MHHAETHLGLMGQGAAAGVAVGMKVPGAAMVADLTVADLTVADLTVADRAVTVGGVVVVDAEMKVHLEVASRWVAAVTIAAVVIVTVTETVVECLAEFVAFNRLRKWLKEPSKEFWNCIIAAMDSSAIQNVITLPKTLTRLSPVHWSKNIACVKGYWSAETWGRALITRDRGCRKSTQLMGLRLKTTSRCVPSSN